ncbi:hypothetical protein MNVM_35410 [Mycobacterium novum]|uniref:Uncharacterized protein n=1 Tax=Mycobacterium novum TaxID=2492438 RepID=A0A7I7JRK2_9MYCO|nr:hypothetical protein MNVM_35410 [Mycobacterium novum]
MWCASLDRIKTGRTDRAGAGPSTQQATGWPPMCRDTRWDYNVNLRSRGLGPAGNQKGSASTRLGGSVLTSGGTARFSLLWPNS